MLRKKPPSRWLQDISYWRMPTNNRAPIIQVNRIGGQATCRLSTPICWRRNLLPLIDTATWQASM